MGLATGERFHFDGTDELTELKEFLCMISDSRSERQRSLRALFSLKVEAHRR